MLLACSLILIVKGVQVCGSLLIMPNQVVDVGFEVVFNSCSSTSHSTHVRWRHMPTNSSSYVTINNGNRLNPLFARKFSVDCQTRPCSLVIRSVDWSDAGQYACRECVDGGLARNCNGLNMQLIVLGSDNSSHLQCQTNITSVNNTIEESDYIGVVCSVNYAGKWSPSTECRVTRNEGSDDNFTQITTDSRSVSNGSDYYTVATGHVALATTKWDGAHIMCTTTFNGMFTAEDTEDVSRNANNLPQYIWRSNSTLKILYGARSVRITTDITNTAFQQGDTLMCAAEGKPTPVIKWVAVINNSSVSAATGHKYTIDVCNVSGISSPDRVDVSLTCRAENNVSGNLRHSSETITFTVACGRLTIVLAVVGGLTASIIISIILVVVIVYFRKRRNSCRMHEKPDIVQDTEYKDLEPYGVFAVSRPDRDVSDYAEAVSSVDGNHADISSRDGTTSIYTGRQHADGRVKGEPQYAEVVITVQSTKDARPRLPVAGGTYASISHQMPAAPSRKRRRKTKR